MRADKLRVSGSSRSGAVRERYGTGRRARILLAWLLPWASLPAAGTASAQGTAEPQTPGESTVVESVAQTLPRAPVVLAGDTLFYVVGHLGPFTAEQRAASTRARLYEATRDGTLRVTPLTVEVVDGRADVRLGETVLTTVTAVEAAVLGLEPVEVARGRAEVMRGALDRRALTTNVRAVLLGLLYTALATAALVLALRVMNHVFPRAQRLVRVWQRTRIRSLRVQNLEVISAERITRLLGGVVSLVRLVLTLLATYVYLLLVFSFFPWTRGVASRLTEYAVDPVVAGVYAFVAYVPHLFYIVVIVVATKYLLKVIHLVFDGIGSGAITLSGFYSDWAETTYKIVRVVVIVMAVILIWPHLPASDRPEFRGVAAFLGLLLSLGSASAVANVIGGVVMVYMRPFQIGDRVKIADTVGDIVEKTLLVTRIRTAKNVDVTVPNSMVLGSHIVNYSSTAREGGLVLHTTVTLGYDVPWRRVHETLITAALATPRIMPRPRPFVLQTALNDYNVSYELNAYTDAPNSMARTYSDLHQNIQDECAAAAIEILSPLYAATRDGSASTIPHDSPSA
jgi:small-conductance mechanosensitive channel